MNFIKRTTKRLLSPQGIKISLSILLISLFFFEPTFAQNATTENKETLKNIGYLLEKLIWLLSWIWILLASLAGKLMTNDMVYGSWLHLDVYLWKLRNICKNFANFWLLAFLLRWIIEFVRGKSQSIQTLITQTLIAWILIQASWFLFAAVIDISTILTAAVSTFPSNFIDKWAIQTEWILKETGKNMHANYIKVDDKGNVSQLPKDNNFKPYTEFNEKEFLEKIMPKDDSVAGPLVYIWATTLRIQKALDFDNKLDPTPKKVVTTLLLNFLMIALYCVTLILLIITNIIRIALLWIIIPLSPIIILMLAMGKSKSMEGKGFMKNFNIWVILHAIFKPVLFTAVMSMILIFVVSMQTVMNGNASNVEIKGTTIGVNPSKWTAIMENEGVMSVEINDKLFTEVWNVSKNIFSGLIIYFATIFMLRYMVKIAAKAWWGNIWETMDKATGLVERMASTAPIFAWYSTRALQEWWGKVLKWLEKPLGMNLDFRWWTAGKLKADAEFQKKLDSLIWITRRDDDDYRTLRESKDFIGTTKSMNWLNQESFSKWESSLNQRLQDENKEIWIEEIDKNKNKYFTWDERTLKTLNEKWLELLHEKLGWKSWEAPKNYQEFLKKVKENYYISKD